MKKHIVAGACLLLTLGTAVAGSLMYGQSGNAQLDSRDSHFVQPPHAQESTPEMIALWKMTAASADYSAPKLPI